MQKRHIGVQRELRTNGIGTHLVRIIIISLCSTLIVFSGCASLSQQVEKCLEAEQYENALELLEKNGVGNSLSEKASEQAIAARDLYSTSVSDRFIRLAEDALKEGKAHQAYGDICKGLENCPWSAVLMEAKKEHSQRVSRLDQLAAEIHILFAEKPESLKYARLALDKLIPVQHVMNDTPSLIQSQQHFRHVLIQHIAEQIRRSGRKLSQSDIDATLNDLLLISSEGEEEKVTTFEEILLLLSRLPDAEDSSQVNLTSQQESDIKSLAEIVNDESTSTGSKNLFAPCYEAARNSFCEFCKEDFLFFVENQDVSFATITLAEQLLVKMPILNETRYCSALAYGHMQRARHRASQGKAAGLALVHIRRAQILDASMTKTDESDLEQLCQASLRAALPIRVSISIDGESSIDPTTYQLLRVAIANQLISRKQNHWAWQWSSTSKEDIVRLYINRGELISTSGEDLSTISSEYLSHYENVPNPAKNSRKIGLDLQKLFLDQAKSRYTYAVNLHNAYPTTYSLQNANNAYTSYTMALNTYNNLVVLYNLTPDTINRPVHLPYTFFEGTVRAGWVADVTIHVGEHSMTTTAKSIESDFVRIGTRFNDISPATRRDDPLSMEMSVSRRIEQLREVSTKICDSLAQLIVHVPIETRMELTDDEQILLSCVLHPFDKLPKTVSKMTEISWGLKLADEVVLPEQDISPTEQQLAKVSNILSAERSAKDIAELYEPLVCEIRSLFGYGSGILISGDGLILTCAHVLLGADNKAVFHSGHFKGEYQLEIIFINETQDIAIARAAGIMSELWAPVRLQNPCTKGEKIVAIGNPGLIDKSVSYGGVSEGIVSNQLIKMKDGQERLVCDINISQGSSGGPLVSMETGEVVGIVTHIVEAGIRPDMEVSTSGYSCLAAPAFKFTDWLGISYKQ